MDEEQTPDGFVEGSPRSPPIYINHYYYHGPTVGRATNAHLGANNGTINQNGSLSTLPKPSPMPDATHNRNRRTSPPDSICLAGTRQKMLQGITVWALDTTFDDLPEDARVQIDETGIPPVLIPKSSHVLWLCGPVGCGKSAISQTLAKELAKKKALLGTFFFFKDSVARSSIYDVAVTLATQMRHAIRATESLVDTALETWGLEQMTAADQFELLIFEPLISLAQPGGPFFAILDGIDECRDKPDVEDLLSYIIGVFDQYPNLPLRFLITSRVEEHIVRGITRPGVHIERLQDSSPDQDILKLVLHRFNTAAAQNRVMKSYRRQWPTRKDIEKLIRHAEGSFIFITTLLNYILGLDTTENDGLTPKERFERALTMNGLDNLYNGVLQGAQELPHFHEVILTFAMTFDPLCAQDIAYLSHTDPSQVLTALLPLRSIIQIPEDDTTPIRPFHASLIDFIRDERRSPGLLPRAHRIRVQMRLAYDCLGMALSPGWKPDYAVSRWHAHWSRLGHPMFKHHGFLATLVKHRVSQPHFQIAFSMFYHGYYFIDLPCASTPTLSLECYRFWSEDTGVRNFLHAAKPHAFCDTCTTEASQLFQLTYMKAFPGPDPAMNRCIVMHSLYGLFEPATRSPSSWVNYALIWWPYHVALAVQSKPNDLDEQALLDFLQIPHSAPRYVSEGEHAFHCHPSRDVYWHEICVLYDCNIDVLRSNVDFATRAIGSKFPHLYSDPSYRKIKNWLSSMPTFVYKVDHLGLSVLDMLHVFSAMLSGLQLDPTGVGVRVMLPREIAWSFYLGQGVPDQGSPNNQYGWGVTSRHTDGSQETWGRPNAVVGPTIGRISSNLTLKLTSEFKCRSRE